MMRESEIKSVFDKIEPSAALVEKTKSSLRTASGEEQSFRINIRWLMPKLAVAVFAAFTLFAVVFVVNRAPAIYDNSVVFENEALFVRVDASQLPAATSATERSVPETRDLEEMMRETADADILKALIVGKIIERDTYLCDGENWGVCIYKVSVSEVLAVADTPDFLSGADALAVTAFFADGNDLLTLPDAGDEVEMLLCKTEDGSAISEYGQRAGISGAWELYGSADVENSK